MKQRMPIHGALALALGTLAVLPTPSRAGDNALCAQVKIEVEQEVTLERQAFDACMRIHNGLTDAAVEAVRAEIHFADEAGNPVAATSDPDQPQALFYFRVDRLVNISDIQGHGVVAPASMAEIHWLIVPAPNASNGLERGALYFVGATLRYTLGGREEVTIVSPDYIFVKPMPELTLDYFLPRDVYGDDAFTPAIEPPVPFSLGVRVRNRGSGAARRLAIESAQPQIVDNEQGLPIDFVITGSEINGIPTPGALAVTFGDVSAGAAAVARWVMTCSLSGTFVGFAADFAHADELGGELTSLIQEVNTHLLLHDVRVDLPGRDAVRDFLALDGDVLRVYESSGLDTEVVDQSAAAAVSTRGREAAEEATLSFPATAGPVHVKHPDPFAGGRMVVAAHRSDGKRMLLDNVWLSKSRGQNQSWEHFLNLFDVNTPGIYTIVFADPADVPQAPVIEYVPDRVRSEGEQLSFLVVASDPNLTVPALDTGTLPVGATFVDRGDGVGIFDWTPVMGQAGEYRVTFTANDGEFDAARSCQLTIYGDERFEIIVEGAIQQRLSFGMVAGASDRFDPGLDEEFDAGSPRQGVVAWLENMDWDDPHRRRLTTDLRAGGPLHRWRLRIELNGSRTATVVSWILGRTDTGKWMYLQPLAGEQAVGLPVNMLDRESLLVSADGAWEICYGHLANETLAVERGWNLIGTRLMTVVPSAALFPAIREQTAESIPFFLWDIAYRAVSPAAPLAPETGYWYFADVARDSIEFAGLPADGRMALRAGWNLVSPVAVCPSPLPAWGWEPLSGTYRRVEIGEPLLPGRACWMFAPCDATIVDTTPSH